MVYQAQLKPATIFVPEEMLPFLCSRKSEIDFQQRALLLYPYIQNGTMSHGKAAEILGISKWTLISLYASLGIPYIDMDEAELERDISVALAAAE